MLSIRSRFALWAAPALLAVSFASTGATITVNNNADPNGGPVDGDGNGCTLRKALQNIFNDAQTFTDCSDAPTVGGPNTIVFSAAGDITQGTFGTFPGIKNQVTITGPKTINGNGSDRIFNVNATTGDLNFTGLTLKGAKTAVRVQNDGKLTVTASTFENNSSNGSTGGAIEANGAINLTNVNFLSNSATTQGGAIYLSGTHVSAISNANFTDNTAGDDGGAIYVSLTSSITPATLEVTNATFQLNKASGAAGTKGGGAVHARASGALSLVSLLNSSFIANEADGNDGRGGAVYNGLSDANMIVDHCVFTLNKANANANSMGGAIYSADNMTVRASSFIGNEASTGKGGAFAGDSSTPSGLELGNLIGNSTIQGNTAAAGAAVYSFGASGNRELKLVNVTIDGNTGSGIFTENVGGGTAITRLANTIVSNNSGGNCTGNNVNNIVGNVQFPGATCAADVVIATGDPKLDAPFINLPDVLTLTMSLQAGSAALRAGDNATCTAFPILDLDQRSILVPIRPLPGGTNCDAGAYESARAPGYGSVPGPGSTITINTFSGVPQTSNVVISETGDDHLTITGFNVTGNPEISVSGPAAPFTIVDGGGTETLVLTCSSAVPSNTSGTLTVNHNATGTPATYTVNCIVVDPLVITTATPMPAGTVGTPYSQFFAATGGTAPYVDWAVTAGSLPPGLTLNAATGELSGTPNTTVGSPFGFTIQVTDTAALTSTKVFSLTVNAAPIPPTITTATPLPTGTTGTAYSQTFTATGGTGALTWTVSLGTLPPGLTLAGGTGALTGTPTLAGTYNFSVTATDTLLLSDTKAFSLTVIDPLVITTATPLPQGTQNVPYAGVTFAATGGTAPYVNWMLTAGALPPGLTLAAGTGLLNGTPTAVGTYNFMVEVTDTAALTSTKAFTLTINPPPTITTATPLPTGTVGSVYSQTFAATDGTPPYVNWTITIGSLPPGLTLAAGTGLLSGTPTLAGPYSFTVQVTDSVGGMATKAFTVTINESLAITTATPLPAGTVSTVYSGVTFAATGGTPPYVNWAVTVGTLPPGLTLAAATGLLSGTPTLAGPYSFTVQVTDNVGGTATKAFTLTVNAALSITTATPLPTGTVGAVYSQTFAAAGGTPPYVNWAVTVGTLPPGLTLTAATGLLAGTPTLAGPYSFTVQVTDNVGGMATKAFTLTVNDSLAITTATPLPAGTAGTVYGGVTFAATGGTPPYVNWAVTVGTLPPGLTLAAATGVLSGTPTTPGTSNFTVQVTDNVGGMATKAFSLTVNPAALSITTATPLPTGSVGAAYSGVTFAATGGTPPYVNWAVTVGTLPPGLTLAPATGVLSGTPTTPGTSNFTVQVTDNIGGTATKAFALTVNASTLSITTASPLPGGTVGAAYSQTFAATGGTPPYVNWAVTAGTLPPGLTLNAATGALTGTPTSAAGSPFSFTIQVTDNVATTATKAFTLDVTAGGCFTGASPLGGNIQACVSGGGPTCAFTPGSAQFIPVTGHALSPPAGTAPSGILFPHGLFAFILSGCTPGSSVTLTVGYPAALDPGTQYWKYGPQPASPTPSWYILPATIGATSVTFTIVDGGLGDDDLLANGTIVDQGGPGVPGGGGGVHQTPTLSQWALVLLALLILAVAAARGRRETGRR